MSSRLREEDSRPRPFYGKVAWSGVQRGRSSDAPAEGDGGGGGAPNNAPPQQQRQQQRRTKLSYEKSARTWSWSDRRRNFSTGLGTPNPVSTAPLLREEEGEGQASRSYSKAAWAGEKPRGRASRPLSQVRGGVRPGLETETRHLLVSLGCESRVFIGSPPTRLRSSVGGPRQQWPGLLRGTCTDRARAGCSL